LPRLRQKGTCCLHADSLLSWYCLRELALYRGGQERYPKSYGLKTLPEYILAAMTAALLGWGGFTWKRAEDAMVTARKASDLASKVELKVAENYLSKKEFELYMDRLFGTLAEMKDGMQYLTERVDYHVTEQAGESKQLKAEIQRLRENTQRRRIDD